MQFTCKTPSVPCKIDKNQVDTVLERILGPICQTGTINICFKSVSSAFGGYLNRLRGGLWPHHNQELILSPVYYRLTLIGESWKKIQTAGPSASVFREKSRA